jgi:hypothetical protein
VLLPHFIGHLLPELHHRYVMYIDPAAAASLRAQHKQQYTIAEYMTSDSTATHSLVADLTVSSQYGTAVAWEVPWDKQNLLTLILRACTDPVLLSRYVCV